MPLYNIDAEQTVLGTVLLSPESSSLIVSMLAIEDFSNQYHRIIFEAIKTVVANGNQPNPILLAPLLANIEIPEMNITCAGYLGKLIAVGVTVYDGVNYALHLREFSSRRAMVNIAQQMGAIANNMAANIADFNVEAIKELDNLCSRINQRRPSSFDVAAIAREAVDRLKSGKKPEIIRSGLTDLDRVIGGLHRGEVIYPAGRPSMGKSALIFSMARQGAKLGTTWLIFSLEMRRQPVINRMLSDAVWNRQSPIPYERIARGDVTPYELERLENASIAMKELSIEIDDQPGLTVAEISVRARRYAESMAKSGRKLDVIAIDHLGKVVASDRYAGNKVHETGEKTNAFSVLCRELDLSGIIAHQLNRGNEKRENKRPEMSDLRDSGDVEQDADGVMFPFRMAYYLERAKEDTPEADQIRLGKLSNCVNLIELNIAKNRNGPCKNIEFYCDMGSNVIRNLA